MNLHIHCAEIWFDCSPESCSYEVLENMHAHHSYAVENFAPIGICVLEDAVKAQRNLHAYSEYIS